MRTADVLRSVAALGLMTLASSVWADEEKVPIDRVPKAVLDAVKAKFPAAELKGAAKEAEDGKTVYEITLKNRGQNIDVALRPDGTILEIEKQIDPKTLPKTVAAALEAKYPKATMKKAEEITVKERVSYEVVLVTAEKKAIEVKLDSNGKVVETEESEGEDDAKP